MAKRRIALLLVIAPILVGMLIVRNYLYVTAWRLYLDGEAAQTERSAATQRFVIERGRVLPEILTTGDDRIRFAVHLDRPSSLRFEARPQRRASYELALIRGGQRRVVARGEAVRPLVVNQPLPPFDGLIELSNHGPLTWVDLKIVRNLRFVPHLVAIALLVCASFVLHRLDPAFTPALGRRGRATVIKLALLAIGISLGLATAEASLRVLGARSGERIAAYRRDLGEALPSPRSVETARYGTRHRAGLDTYSEVRFGDIVWMGFVPPEVTSASTRRFPFHTDEEGFRNAAVRDPIAVAALGDSFTDAMTLRQEEAWPARLEARLGVPVQNYGTAGFGPQQEERVLKDFVLRHRPQVVVVAFFAGNDIFNAESFDEFEHSPEHDPRLPPGWRIKDTVARFDELYLVSLARATSEAYDKGRLGLTAALADGQSSDVPEPIARPTATPSFDRGMFRVPVAGRELSVALMPPYLNTLTFSAESLRARRGWRLTRLSLQRMQRLCRASGVELVVMFIPFKSQVYLPLLARSFPPEELERALSFYFRGSGTTVRAASLEANRLAQNELMKAFCAEQDLAFLDLTPLLEAAVEAGRNVYFPDDAHWNAAGHEVAAQALASFLSESGIPHTRKAK